MYMTTSNVFAYAFETGILLPNVHIPAWNKLTAVTYLDKGNLFCAVKEMFLCRLLRFSFSFPVGRLPVLFGKGTRYHGIPPPPSPSHSCVHTFFSVLHPNWSSWSSTLECVRLAAKISCQKYSNTIKSGHTFGRRALRISLEMPFSHYIRYSWHISQWVTWHTRADTIKPEIFKPLHAKSISCVKLSQIFKIS
jgi:hypothetical protein